MASPGRRVARCDSLSRMRFIARPISSVHAQVRAAKFRRAAVRDWFARMAILLPGMSVHLAAQSELAAESGHSRLAEEGVGASTLEGQGCQAFLNSVLLWRAYGRRTTSACPRRAKTDRLSGSRNHQNQD